MQLENYIDFDGILLLENNLKADSQEVIKTLKDCRYDVKVISGDNPFTVTKACQDAGIIDTSKQVIFFESSDNKTLTLRELNGPKPHVISNFPLRTEVISS